MKYVHDGKNYVLFTAFDGYSHRDVVSMLHPFKINHAGFVSFLCDEKTKEAQVFGDSVSLNIKSQVFGYDDINYVGLTENNKIMISNAKKLLEKLKCTNITEGVWKESLEGYSGECPVMYIGHPLINVPACRLVRNY